MFSEWNYIDSTRAEAIRVNNETNQLDIKFKPGGVICRYEGAAHHYDGILNSGSAGRYINIELAGWSYVIVNE